MLTLPTSLYRAEDVRELDRIAIEQHGIAGISLMERAGLAAWDVLQTSWPAANNIVVLCGGGNNAGDGYILARLAAEHHCSVRVLTTHQPAALKGDARTAADKLLAQGVSCEAFAADLLAGADVIVDALLGTGIDRQVSGEFQQAIEAINASGKDVLAIDIPSGLNADSGCPMGSAIRADVTITFIGLKQGLFSGEAAAYSGKILFSDLDVPPDVYHAVASSAQRMELAQLSRLLPKRSRSSHKGHYGHVLLIGGDAGFVGAVMMASEAAARVGAGLVSCATQPAHAGTLPLAIPEVMSHGIQSATDLRPLLERATVIAIGPGLGQSAWSMSLLSRVLDTDLPVVADADALNLIAQDPSYSDQWVLTPHPGEAARLLGNKTVDVQADRFAAATACQEKYGGVIVLKGSGTIVAARDASLGVCDAGNPGMATGGMGDILTGVIAGLLAQGLDIDDAARLGVCLHAAAADAAARQGERGMLATDLMPWLRKLVNP
ncbi:MAG: NAD(P)H-hydrate dehydratase [Gammaproteobacteria bacterium]|nr:NAD(P)H-hydrate dehydratase [Gammaproteobacteria bacterium]